MLAIIGLSLLLSTITANAQWQQINEPSGGGIYLLASGAGTEFIAVSSSGAFYSTDNGASWNDCTGLSVGISHLSSVGTHYFGGTGAGIFECCYGCNGVWQQSNTGINGSYIPSYPCFGISNGSSTEIFAGSNGGNTYYSSNMGLSWTMEYPLYTPINSLVYNSTNTEIFAGTNNGVYLSTNNGVSWTQKNNGLLNTSVRSLVISGTNIFAGTYGGVFLSTNSGANWTSVNNGITTGADTVITKLFVSNSLIFASVATKLLMSRNDGASWIDISGGLISGISDFAVKGNDLYVAGGHIWKRSLTELNSVGIEEINSGSNIEVYPNPTTNNITIANPQQATIEISNIQGQLINTFTATGNKTNIDVSALPCGVYVVEVKTEKGVSVSKFVKE